MVSNDAANSSSRSHQVLIGYGVVANEIGSHLLGAFIAGMSFCWMEPALMLWHSQVKRIANWLIRLFFGW